MQKIEIESNEFDEFYEKEGYRYITEIIYDKENREINLRGLSNILLIDQSNNREPSDDLKLKFIRWYIDKKGIKFCPYCGKNYLAYFCNEVYKRNYNGYKKGDCKPSGIISGFDIEHFFPKNYQDTNGNKPYAQLAKNLYNWHLSCTICNQRLKKDRDVLGGAVKEDPIFNPYFGWIYKDYENVSYIPYIVNYLLKSLGIHSFFYSKIKVDDSSFDEKVTFVGFPQNKYDDRKQVFSTYHGKFFRLGEIYLNDQETFNIFSFICDKYTKIKDEYQRFKKTSKSIEEFVDYFFKNYYPEKEEDILKYSNGKFKKDLIEYMGKILEEEFNNKF